MTPNEMDLPYRMITVEPEDIPSSKDGSGSPRGWISRCAGEALITRPQIGTRKGVPGELLVTLESECRRDLDNVVANRSC